MIGRRQFLARLAGAAAAVAAAPFLPELPLSPTVMTDTALGISVRFVQRWDVSACRLDVLYGWGAITPPLACRVEA